MTTQELQAWQKYLVGKKCQFHPDRKLKMGKWGLWCGSRAEDGSWCIGQQFPDKEWLDNYRKENANDN